MENFIAALEMMILPHDRYGVMQEDGTWWWGSFG